MLIKAARLSQTEAAKRFGVDQPHDVVITIRDPEDDANPSVRVLVEA